MGEADKLSCSEQKGQSMGECEWEAWVLGSGRSAFEYFIEQELCDSAQVT